MAEIDAKTAGALCIALQPLLSSELCNPVTCRDVSANQGPWDLEAVDSSGTVVRGISCVRALDQGFAQASAEVCKELWPDLERELAAIGVRNCYVTFGVRELPKTKAGRRSVTLRLAQRIRDHLGTGRPLRDEEIPAILEGRDAWNDDISRGFYDVAVVRSEKNGPAKVMMASSHRTTTCEPELLEVVVPAIEKKIKKHGTQAQALTLVVQVFDRPWSPSDLAATQAGLQPSQRVFCSAYVSRTSAVGPAIADRLY